MKTKKAIIHIENPVTRKCMMDGCKAMGCAPLAYCGRYEGFLYPWEKAKDMKPRCKTCLKAVEAEKRRRG